MRRCCLLLVCLLLLTGCGRADERRQERFDAWQALCGEVDA